MDLMDLLDLMDLMDLSGNGWLCSTRCAALCYVAALDLPGLLGSV